MLVFDSASRLLGETHWKRRSRWKVQLRRTGDVWRREARNKRQEKINGLALFAGLWGSKKPMGCERRQDDKGRERQRDKLDAIDQQLRDFPSTCVESCPG